MKLEIHPEIDYTGPSFSPGQEVICVNNDNIIFNSSEDLPKNSSSFDTLIEPNQWSWDDKADELLELNNTYIVKEQETFLNRQRLVIHINLHPFKENDWFYPHRFLTMKQIRKLKLQKLNQ